MVHVVRINLARLHKLAGRERLIFPAVMLLLLIICSVSLADEVVPLTQSDIRTFFVDRTPSSRMEAFRKYPPSQQLQIFLLGNQVVHPPAKYLAECFALGGSDAVAVVRAKLEVPGGNLDTRDLSKLLVVTQESGTYDVRSDGSLLRLLAGRISVMRDEGWKDTAEQFFDRIVSEPSPPRGAEQLCPIRRAHES